MQSILVRSYNLTCVAWDIEMCISTEEIIIMKDGKLFLSSILSFSHLRIQIFHLINHFCCTNKRCVEMLSKKKVLNEAFHFHTRISETSAHTRSLDSACIHVFTMLLVEWLTYIKCRWWAAVNSKLTEVHSNTVLTILRVLHVVDQIKSIFLITMDPCKKELLLVINLQKMISKLCTSFTLWSILASFRS